MLAAAIAFLFIRFTLCDLRPGECASVTVPDVFPVDVLPPISLCNSKDALHIILDGAAMIHGCFASKTALAWTDVQVVGIEMLTV
jgi:hypothetical protein